MRRIGLVLAMIGLGSLPAAAQNATPGAGQEVAQRWCINCHVVSPEQKQGSDQVPTLRSIANRPATTAESLQTFLMVPHGRMPDQALSNADRAAVIAYILSLKQ